MAITGLIKEGIFIEEPMKRISGISFLFGIYEKGMKIVKTGTTATRAGHIGSVQDVIEAKIAPELLETRIQADAFLYGFELASPKGASSLGEAVIVDGLCYATSTDETSADYGKVISGPSLIPGGVFLLPHGSKPAYQVSHEGETMNFDDLYEEILGETQGPFCFVGKIYFETLHAIFIGKPPIDGKNIFEHKEAYYQTPELHLEGVYGFVMAVVSKGESLAEKKLDTVLYRNPFDSPSNLVYHAHILVLSKKGEKVQPENVTHCLHLLNAGTTFSWCEVEVYPINTVEKFQ